MRRRAWLAMLVSLAACSPVATDRAVLILNDPYWPKVNVEVVFTKSADCDNHQASDRTQKLVMVKNKTERFEAREGEQICYRHDRDPNNPTPQSWSGWTKVTLFPGEKTELDL
jgi:hypothetical protein